MTVQNQVPQPSLPFWKKNLVKIIIIISSQFGICFLGISYLVFVIMMNGNYDEIPLFITLNTNSPIPQPIGTPTSTLTPTPTPTATPITKFKIGQKLYLVPALTQINTDDDRYLFKRSNLDNPIFGTPVSNCTQLLERDLEKTALLPNQQGTITNIMFCADNIYYLVQVTENPAWHDWLSEDQLSADPVLSIDPASGVSYKRGGNVFLPSAFLLLLPVLHRRGGGVIVNGYKGLL